MKPFPKLKIIAHNTFTMNATLATNQLEELLKKYGLEQTPTLAIPEKLTNFRFRQNSGHSTPDSNFSSSPGSSNTTKSLSTSTDSLVFNEHL